MFIYKATVFVDRTFHESRSKKHKLIKYISIPYTPVAVVTPGSLEYYFITRGSFFT